MAWKAPFKYKIFWESRFPLHGCQRSLSMPIISQKMEKTNFWLFHFLFFFYLLFYLEMNESISLYRFPCNSAAFEPSACCLWFLPAEWSWYLLSHILHVPRSFAYAQDDTARRESSTGSRQRFAVSRQQALLPCEFLWTVISTTPSRFKRIFSHYLVNVQKRKVMVQ